MVTDVNFYSFDFSDESIEKAIKFYGLDIYPEIIENAKTAAKKIRESKELLEIVKNTVSFLFFKLGKTNEENSYCNEKVFGENHFDFFAVDILLSGYEIHKENLKSFDGDEDQIRRSVLGVMYSIRGEIINKKYSDLRPLFLFWGSNFTKNDIFQNEGLQYQITDGGKIDMHIPSTAKISTDEVVHSIKTAIPLIEKYFGLKDGYDIECHSWLLSPDIKDALKEGSHILQFQNIFDIEGKGNCLAGLFEFLFKIPITKDYNTLPEDTSLQRFVKAKLLNGEIIRYGFGTVKKEIING